tara:strand:- start:4838 stop:7660 length:2823 start_codon:yes stop_codon:yes gene_type:complete
MSEIATLNTSILGLSGTMENFIKSLGKFEKFADSTKGKVKELTKVHDALGLKLENNELVSKRTGNRVNEFGQEVTKVGDKMLAFNKRSSILNETIKSLNKSNERFNLGMKSFKEYQKRGGNLAEYLAEFISSSREEITIFGVEAAKARKVMYGFLPPGMFRMLNKVSSTLQLFGGQYRKLVTDSSAAKEEIELLTEALKVATDETEIKGLQERLADLETPDNLFTNLFKGFKKVKGLLDKPLPLNFDQDGINEMDTYAQKAKALFMKNFTLTLTPDKKLELERTKDLIKSLKKPIQVSMDDLNKAREQKGSLLGIDRSEVKKAEKELMETNKKLAEVEALKQNVAISSPTIAMKFNKEINELKQKSIDLTSKMLDEESKYEIALQKAVGDASDFDPNIKRIKDLEKALATEKELEDEGRNGIRKTYTDLYRNLGEMQEAFKKGVDNSEAILQIETSIGKTGSLISDAEKTMEALVSRAEMFPDNPEYFDSVVKQQEVINELMERQENLQGALISKQAEGKGLDKLKKEIVENDLLIAQKEEFIMLMEEEVRYNKQKISDAKELLAAGNLNKKATEAAFKEIEERELNISGAFTNIQDAEESIDTAKEKNVEAEEQIEILKDMRENSIDKLLEKHPFFSGINKLRKGLKKVLPALGQALRMFMMGFLYVSMAILAVLALVKLFGPIIKETIASIITVISPIIGFIIGAASMVFEGIKSIFNAFFGDGTFEDAIDGLIKIGLGLLGMAIGLIGVVLGALGTLILAGVGSLFKRALGFLKGMLKNTKAFLKGMAVILGIAATIVALIMGAPVLFALAIGVAVFKGFSILIKPITKAIKYIKKKFKDFLDILPFAEGGTVSKTGMQLVGEKGPELVSLPKGSRVHTNSSSRKMLAGGGTSNTNNINVTINAKDTSRAEMDRIAKEVSRTITNSIQRQNNTSNLR